MRSGEKNLASLAEPFAIEFERAPLRAAGLFAITGETGAGKSTILDALCLALYDEFPRVLAPGARDNVPDASGADIRENDPRTILRRGAGRGFAEADFIGRDGRRYRARCDLMRARGKVAGKLQNRGRSLWRIDESGGKIETLESGVEPVNRRVVELTDLTFDQFRRTALLAQGDFDAFLRADAKERADLLEKITGAEVYGLLSKRVYEQWDAARKALAALEARRADVGVMAQEDRAAILSESADVVERRATLGAAHKETLAALRRLEARAQAQEKLAQAEGEWAAATQALEALAGERQTLVDLGRAEPLRAPLAQLRKAQANLVEKQAAADDAAAQAEKARAALEDAQTAARVGAEALAARRKELADFEPVWAQAREFDARIAAQGEEVAEARDGEAELARRLATARQALASARAQLATQTKAHEAARDAVEKCARAEPLSERWTEIAEWLEKRVDVSAKLAETQRALEETAQELTRADAIRAACEEAEKGDREALAATLAQSRAREDALLALDLPACEERAEALGRMHDLAREMAHCARAHDAAASHAAAAAQDAMRFGEESAARAAASQSLRAARAAKSAEAGEAERLGELADAALDPHAIGLRAALEAGEACPVCGATDHPFARAEDAAQALASALRAKRDAARRALKAIDNSLAESSRAEATARARHEEANRLLAEAKAVATRAETDYAALVSRAGGLHAPASIVGATAAIEAKRAEMARERDGLARIVATGRGLRTEIDGLRRAADKIRNAIETHRAQLQEADALARRARESRAALTEAFAAASERIESLDRSLARYLAVCDLQPADLDRDPEGARRRLRDAGAHYARARDEAEAAHSALARLAPQAATLAEQERALAEQAATAAAACALRAEALTTLQEARARLLGGEATATHVAARQESALAAARAHDALQRAHGQADREKAAHDAHCLAAAEAVAAAGRAVGVVQGELAAALSASGLGEAAAMALLSISPEEAAVSRRAVDAAVAACARADSALAERRRDLADADAQGPREQGLPEETREALVSRETETATMLEALSTRLGVLGQRLEQDDAAQARAAALSQEIEGAGAALKVLAEVNEAIGSREGDKFRRFAQSVTLEQLVALANRRLALLSPRYALERAGEIGSLGLQIIDHALGDERRSTRSLSGGERFLASLALALALAGLEGRDSFVDTLFIDEGFGALDSATLDVAIDALENLQGQGRKVGVISHVDALHARVATKICVERRGGGVSVLRLRAPGFEG